MTEKQLAEFFIEQRVVEPSQAEDVLREVELNGKTVAFIRQLLTGSAPT